MKESLEKEGKSTVSFSNVEEFAQKHNIKFVTECSAKLNYNITDTFKKFYIGKIE